MPVPDPSALLHRASFWVAGFGLVRALRIDATREGVPAREEVAPTPAAEEQIAAEEEKR